MSVGGSESKGESILYQGVRERYKKCVRPHYKLLWAAERVHCDDFT